MHVQFTAHDGRKSLSMGPYKKVLVEGNALIAERESTAMSGVGAEALFHLASYDPSIGMWIQDDTDYWKNFEITS